MIDAFSNRWKLALGVISLMLLSPWMSRAGNDHFPVYPGKKTVALWLFDEANYPHTTLTDAGINEYDLRLMERGKLVSGRFGNALGFSPGEGWAAAYAGFKGAVPGNEMRGENGEPSGLWGPTIAPEKILATFAAASSWTLEFWLRVDAIADREATVLDMGRAYDPGIRLALRPGRERLVFANAYAGYRAIFTPEIGRMTDGVWHHVALVHDASSDDLAFYVDGRPDRGSEREGFEPEPVPSVRIPEDREHYDGSFTVERSVGWRQRHRFNLSIGETRKGGMEMEGAIDELRFSKVARYSGRFDPPKSVSFNYGRNAPPAEEADGPSLLFGADSPSGPVRVGSRKHVFIDAAMLDKLDDAYLACNPPSPRQNLNFRPQDSAWRPSVVEVDGKVYMYMPDGYSSQNGIVRLRISKDGTHFKKPTLGVSEWNGSSRNNFVLTGVPMYGTFFKDTNPEVPPFARYKLTAWVANRGIYLYVSPDGVHWRRNETCLLPLVTGGGAETFWDDQRGRYQIFIKRDSSFNTESYPGSGRRAVMFHSQDMYKTWPFKHLEEPYFESWPFPAVTGEGPVAMQANDNGQVYRTRAMKYPWAPDTYVAFVWRFQEGNETRRVDLGVSRDGVHWKFYADQKWYITPEENEEVLSMYGMIRRNDELWHYVDYGGAHGGDRPRTYARLIQRLDGFVALTDRGGRGTAVTRPLEFKGKRLTLNVKAEGWLKVAIVNGDGNAIPGYGFGNCDAIESDSVNTTVTWSGESDVSPLAGETIRLRFRLHNAELYAMQFVK